MFHNLEKNYNMKNEQKYKKLIIIHFFKIKYMGNIVELVIR